MNTTKMTELAEKILRNINTVFVNDPLLDEYDVLAVAAPESNKNPVVVEGHKVGIEAWAAGAVYQLCYNRMMSALSNTRTRLRDPDQLSECTRVVVMVVAECMTAWNLRKELLEAGHLTMKEELHLVALILKKHPKSSECFAHRKWLLSQILPKPQGITVDKESTQSGPSCSFSQTPGVVSSTDSACFCSFSLDGTVDVSASLPPESPGGSIIVSEGSVLSCPPGVCTELSESVRQTLCVEMELCQAAAHRYTNNYHAWTHRIWVLQRATDTRILESELVASDRFLCERVSDYSAYHHRVYVLRQLGNIQGISVHLTRLEAELCACTQSLTAYPGHEAIWYYRKFLLHEILTTVTKQSPTRQASVTKKLRAISSLPSVCEIRQREYDLCVQETEKSKVTPTRELLWQEKLAHRHKDWVDNVLVDITR